LIDEFEALGSKQYAVEQNISVNLLAAIFIRLPSILRAEQTPLVLLYLE
jgi:hypothetical protein